MERQISTSVPSDNRHTHAMGRRQALATGAAIAAAARALFAARNAHAHEQDALGLEEERARGLVRREDLGRRELVGIREAHHLFEDGGRDLRDLNVGAGGGLVAQGRERGRAGLEDLAVRGHALAACILLAGLVEDANDAADAGRDPAADAPGFADNQAYGFGTNTWTESQKSTAVAREDYDAAQGLKREIMLMTLMVHAHVLRAQQGSRHFLAEPQPRRHGIAALYTAGCS